jgi:hypothetical protein
MIDNTALLIVLLKFVAELICNFRSGNNNSSIIEEV